MTPTTLSQQIFVGETILESVYLENTTAKELEEYAKSYVALQTKLVKVMARTRALDQGYLLDDAVMNRTNLDSPTPINSRVEAVRVYNFEIDLATVIRAHTPTTTVESGAEIGEENMSDLETLIETKSENKTAEKVSLSFLDSEYDFINWTKTFNLLPGPPNVTHVYIQDLTYLDALKDLFSRHSRETIDNYLCWTFVARFLPYSSRKMKKVYEEFKRQIPESASTTSSLMESTHASSGADQSRSLVARWKECVHLTCEGLKLPTSVLYYLEKEDHLNKVKTRASDIIQNIKAAFGRVMDTQSWLKSQEIKKLLQERIESIESRIALPDYLYNSSVIDDLYSTLAVDSEQVLLNNVINITRHEVLLDLEKLNQKPDPSKDWLMQPLVSNAYFDAMNDHISKSCLSFSCLLFCDKNINPDPLLFLTVLPVGILRHPLVNEERPE